MRVLLIEDDSATAQVIELMLKSEGFNVYTTDLGEEGVDLGKLYDYDIILLDLSDSKYSGREAADLLEENGITVNKNGIPNDPRSFIETSGIRIGTAAETTRGHDEQWFKELADKICQILI